MIRHDWTETTNGKFLLHNGRKDQVVKTTPDPDRGYVWVHRKQYGYAETIEMAKEWVEAAAEFYPRHLPAN